MNEIIIPAAKRLKTDELHILYELPDYARFSYALWGRQQNEKKIYFDKLTIKKPFKARTTGDKSQNHHANGHCQQLCMELGWDMEVMRFYTKKLAISRGYPFDTDPDGETIPWSETRIDTTQCGYWIDAIHQFADENNIVLIEGD